MNAARDDAPPESGPDPLGNAASGNGVSTYVNSDAPHEQTPLKRSTAARVVETTQIVLTALILAFVFRAFFIEPFIIPTGSMAHALLGAHGARLCPTCGWEFDYGPEQPARADDRTFYVPPHVVCPNCHAQIALQADADRPRAGDRILVHKWPYVLGGPLGPRHWDVIVFRSPADPSLNYIKRLIGLPGDTVEIIDGDVFINGRIATKTAAAQRELWSVVCDQSRMPIQSAPVAAGALPPPRESTGANVGWSDLDLPIVRYNGMDSTERTIAFDPHDSPLYSQDLSAFNRDSSRAVVRDVRLICEITFRDGDGYCRWELIRGSHRHTPGDAPTPAAGASGRGVFRRGPPGRLDVGYLHGARVHRDGRVQLKIVRRSAAGESRDVSVQQARVRAFRAGRPVLIEFGHVDYRVYLKVDGRQVLASSETAYAPELDALRRTRSPDPIAIGIAASSTVLELRGLRIDRDVYYTRSPDTVRAFAGKPFALGAGEYFVLGDNSANSRDGRAWNRRGPNLPADEYRLGTVRADQIVGRAFFVYLPGLMPVERFGHWRVPDLGRVRFIR